MKLIDLLVKELPLRGGWPDGVTHVGQDYDRELRFYGRGEPRTGIILDELAVDHRKIGASDKGVTKSQYDSALAASDGWIEWHGGECPVDSDAIVEIKNRRPIPFHFNNDRAGDFDWAHTGSSSDIIAYRLHKPDAKSEQVRAGSWRAYAGMTEKDEEDDLNECIGQGVAAEWDGEGLPPAGCECEARYRTDNAEWAFFRCVGVDCGVAFGWSGKEAVTLGIDNYEFRPLRTEAERKRDAAIEAIDWFMPECIPDTPNEFYHAKKIYDAIAAGKIPGVKLEVK